MKNSKFLILLIFTCFVPIHANSQSLQQSHIESNLPDTYEEFIEILENDLVSYFSESEGKTVSIEYQLLRKQPTQSGVSYPKFYAWVKILTNGTLIKQGAVRVAAIDKVKINVSNFVTSKSILADSPAIETIFPKAICKDIQQRAEAEK